MKTAVASGKVFTIYGSYPDIRNGLLERGWVEKQPPVYDACEGKQQQQQHSGLKPRRPKGDAAVAPSQLSSSSHPNSNSCSTSSTSSFERYTGLANAVPSLIWSPLISDFDLNTIQPQQLINHFDKIRSLVTKAGLAESVKELAWTASVDPMTIHPRAYNLSNSDDCADFLENYRENAAWALIRMAETWSVPRHLLDLAMLAAECFLARRRHEDVDQDDTSLGLRADQWHLLITYQTQCCYEQGQPSEAGATKDEEVREDRPPVDDLLAERIRCVIEELRRYLPQFDMSGVRNVWILKPAASSRGRGISCEHRLDRILKNVGIDPAAASLWTPGGYLPRGKATHREFVVQKYIETPCLVQKTKFDVRQWVLVTSWDPLTVYFYRRSYLRFSSRPFQMDTASMGDGEEAKAVHLCNNSIQAHLDSFAEAWADGCMWTCERFSEWLRSAGHKAEDPWSAKVFPEMQAAAKHVFEAVQDRPDSRKNSFELFGIDYMLDEALNVWLIEINSSPAISHSTKVTEELVPAMLEDLLKVVVDGGKEGWGDWIPLVGDAVVAQGYEDSSSSSSSSSAAASSPSRPRKHFTPQTTELHVIGSHVMSPVEAMLIQQRREAQAEAKEARERQAEQEALADVAPRWSLFLETSNRATGTSPRHTHPAGRQTAHLPFLTTKSSFATPTAKVQMQVTSHRTYAPASPSPRSCQKLAIVASPTTQQKQQHGGIVFPPGKPSRSGARMF